MDVKLAQLTRYTSSLYGVLLKAYHPSNFGGEGSGRTSLQFIQLLKNIIPRKIILLFVVAIVSTMFLRTTGLEHKIVHHDEAITLLQIAGAKDAEQRLSSAGLISAPAMRQQLEQLNAQSTVWNSISMLAQSDPHHPPLNIIITRFSALLFGNSIQNARAVSAIISLFAFPFLFWLCLELFGDVIISWSAVLFFGCSSFFFLYSQEARPYSLWTTATLFSSAALLRALRRKTNAAWIAYSASLIYLLYSHLLGVEVYLSHFVYLFLCRAKDAQNHKFIQASLLPLVLFIPWVVNLALHADVFSSATLFVESPIPIGSLLMKWMRNISLSCFDGSEEPFIVIAACFLFAASRKTESKHRKSFCFLIILMGFSFVPFAFVDLAWGGIRSEIPRYQTVLFLGIIILLAFFWEVLLRKAGLGEIWHAC